MSQKSEKKQRRQLNKSRHNNFFEYAKFLRSMPIYHRLKAAKEIVKGNGYGIIILLVFLCLILIYTITILFIGAKFNDIIIEFVNRRF